MTSLSAFSLYFQWYCFNSCKDSCWACRPRTSLHVTLLLHLSSIAHRVIMHHLPLSFVGVHKDRSRTDYWSKCTHFCTSSLADHFDYRLPHRTNSLLHFKQTWIKGHLSHCWTTVITKGNARSTEVPTSCERLATCSECIPVFCPATVGLNSSTTTDKKQREDMEQRIKCTHNKDLSHIRLQNAQRPTINRIFLFTPWRAAAVNLGGDSFCRYYSLSCQPAEEFPSEEETLSLTLVHFLTLPRDRTPCLAVWSSVKPASGKFSLIFA